MLLSFEGLQLLNQLLVSLLHHFFHFLLPGLLPLPLDIYIALENTFDFQLCLLQLLELRLLGLCHAEVREILLLLHVEDESSREVLLRFLLACGCGNGVHDRLQAPDVVQYLLSVSSLLDPYAELIDNTAWGTELSSLVTVGALASLGPLPFRLRSGENGLVFDRIGLL